MYANKMEKSSAGRGGGPKSKKQNNDPPASIQRYYLSKFGIAPETKEENEKTKTYKKKISQAQNIAEEAKESSALINHNFFQTPVFEKNEFVENEE